MKWRFNLTKPATTVTSHFTVTIIDSKNKFSSSLVVCYLAGLRHATTTHLSPFTSVFHKLCKIASCASSLPQPAPPAGRWPARHTLLHDATPPSDMQTCSVSIVDSHNTSACNRISLWCKKILSWMASYAELLKFSATSVYTRNSSITPWMLGKY